MNASSRSVLVADPDHELRKAICERLRAERLEAIEASDGRSALKQLLESKPDLLLTELFLPDITGLNLCRRVRESREVASTPVVILTSYSDEMDRITSFELGADDFVSKPVSLSELLARCRAILRRSPLPSPETQRPAVDAGAARPHSGEGQLAELTEATPRELQILAELMRNDGRVVTREELVGRIWSSSASATPRTVDAHIKSLRRKLGDSQDRIRTVRGVGYSYEER